MPALGTHLCAAADLWPFIDEVGTITLQVAFRQREGLIQSLTAMTWGLAPILCDHSLGYLLAPGRVFVFASEPGAQRPQG